MSQVSQHTSSFQQFVNKSKPIEVRRSNITAAKAIADVIRTSLGPRGMDKMIQKLDGKSAIGEVIITNDGATILRHMSVIHPCSKMLVELSEAQDTEAGDGTTSVVIIAGSLLGAAERLLDGGIHPSVISDAFKLASKVAVDILEGMSVPISLADTPTLTSIASTSLNSKVKIFKFAFIIGCCSLCRSNRFNRCRGCHASDCWKPQQHG